MLYRTFLICLSKKITINEINEPAEIQAIAANAFSGLKKYHRKEYKTAKIVEINHPL